MAPNGTRTQPTHSPTVGVSGELHEGLRASGAPHGRSPEDEALRVLRHRLVTDQARQRECAPGRPVGAGSSIVEVRFEGHTGSDAELRIATAVDLFATYRVH